MEEYYTTQEIAEMLRAHPRTIIKYINDKILKASKIGIGWKVSEKDLRRSIESRANTGRPISGD